MTITSIYKPIQPEMDQVEGRLRQVIGAAPCEMAEQLDHVLKSSGKRIRPAMALLAGKYHHYNVESLLPLAAGVELLHTATLIHDDTLDDSHLRRGKLSLNRLLGNHNAVLLGDYLFAISAHMTTETENIRVIKLFAQTLMSICNGQIEESLNPFNTSREQYFQMIGNKTASLFSTATESGAVLSEAREDTVQSLKSYGYNIGMAFQIVDDILDFVGQKLTMGKPIVSDLSRGVFTLAVILLFERPAGNRIKEIFDKDKEGGVNLIMETVQNSSVIEECYEIAQGFCSQACSALERIPHTPAYESMINLANYVTQRKR